MTQRPEGNRLAQGRVATDLQFVKMQCLRSAMTRGVSVLGSHSVLGMCARVHTHLCVLVRQSSTARAANSGPGAKIPAHHLFLSSLWD